MLKSFILNFLNSDECLKLKKWVGHNNSKKRSEKIKFKKLKKSIITKNSSLWLKKLLTASFKNVK